MNIHTKKLEFQLSLAEKLAGFPSSKLFPGIEQSSNSTAASINLPQKLLETRISMHERELDALESMSQLQQREATISRLEANVAELREALATSQRGSRQIQSQLKAFADINPQDINNLRSENASLKTQLAAMQQQLHTQAVHSRDFAQCASRVQSLLKNNAAEVSTKLDKKDAECRALRQEQVLLMSKLGLLEAAVGGGNNKHSALVEHASSVEIENSNLNHYSDGISTHGVYNDVMELQKELAAALNRVRERESQGRKYKAAVRTLKSRLEQEHQLRNEAENRANIAVAQNSSALEREQQLKEASRDGCAAAVRLAERRAIEAERRIVTLEAALSQLQSIAAKKINTPPKEEEGKEASCWKKERENQDYLRQVLAVNNELREELQQEKALRIQQESVLASKTKALVEAERRQKQLDGIINRFTGNLKV